MVTVIMGLRVSSIVVLYVINANKLLRDITTVHAQTNLVEQLVQTPR